MRTTTVTIDTQALTHNIDRVKQYAPTAKMLAMVKADAYGHGLANCLPTLIKHVAVDAIGVACFSEAKQARLLGWSKTLLLIEGVFSEAQWQQSLSYECQSMVHHWPQVEWALKHPPQDDAPSRTLWLKLNTGMNRLGFMADEIVAVAQKLNDAGYTLILASHFANADDPNHHSNAEQIATFRMTLNQLQQQVDSSIQASLCNSAGLIAFADCHYDWIRPGIMLYGSSPCNALTAAELKLKPVMHFTAALMAIHPIAQGACIGYGSIYTAEKPMIKGIVSVGYGDGYPRVVSNKTWVSLHQNGNRYVCPIIGRVSMDMIAIDISEVPEPQLGAAVTLWGDTNIGEPNVDEIATMANTIGYELLCRMTQRPTRNLI